MKKLFAILAVMGVLSFGMTQTAMAQDSTATCLLPSTWLHWYILYHHP